MRTTHNILPVAVVASGPSAAAGLLGKVLDGSVTVLDPYDLAMERRPAQSWQAVVVENFTPARAGGLELCTAARWLLPRRGLTVVNGDDPAGQRFARRAGGAVFAWSDGDPRADLTANNINLRWGRLEFDALVHNELTRIRLPAETDVYAALSALSCAVGLGMPLKEAARRLAGAES